jgi:hypothetical protein
MNLLNKKITNQRKTSKKLGNHTMVHLGEVLPVKYNTII